MKIEFVRGRYEYYSGKVGELTRQLGLGGIALVWAFKGPNDKSPIIPVPLILPAALIALSLGCDFLQYVLGALFWGVFHRLKEWNRIAGDQDFDAPDWINWPALVFFWLKILCMIVAYSCIIRYLLQAFHRS